MHLRQAPWHLSSPGGGGGGVTSPSTPPADSNGSQDALPALSEGLAADPGEAVQAVSGLAGFLENLLPGGSSEFPVVSSAIERSYEDDTVSAYSDGSIKSISSDGSGGFRVTLLLAGEDGEADEERLVHFPADSFTDEDGWERFYVELDGDEFNLSDETNSFEQADKTRGSPNHAYFDILELHGSDDESNIRVTFTFGVRTPGDGLPKGTATYYGRLSADAWNADDRNVRHDYRGELTLEADFSGSSISGVVNELESRRRGGDLDDMSADNRIDITGGRIVNGRFVADWTGQGPEGGPVETVRGMEGQILGEFYGPGAEEVAGVVNGRRAATSSDPAQVINGHFSGNGDDGLIVVGEPTLSDHGPQITRYRDLRNPKPRITDPPGTARVTSIEQNNSGGYRVTYVVDGREMVIEFEAPDQNNMRRSPDVTNNGNEFYLGLFRGEAFTRDHLDIVYTGADLRCDDCYMSVWSAVGDETAPERLQSLGSASYAGEFWSQVVPPNGGLSRNWRQIAGEVVLDADFASSSISGLIDGLSMRPSERESGSDDPPWADLPISNSIVISNGRITDSRFRADWAGQDTDATADLDRSMRGFEGEMAGAFYGPDGEEVGGVVAGGRRQEWLVQGTFAGERDTAATGN